jgi:alkylation response protein AidB-like acyl-CoA dehydrogenase
MVSGRWPFASGCQNASWFWGGSLVDDAGPLASPEADGRGIQFLIPLAEMEVLDTWHVAGLRGSGSHDVRVAETFVPDARATDIYGRPLLHETPLARYPVTARFSFTKPGVAAGIARAAIDAFVELATAKPVFRSRSTLRQRVPAQLAAADAEATLGAGRAFLLEAVNEVWATICAGETPTKEQRIRQRLAAAHSVQCSVRAVDLVHAAAGTPANQLANRLERCFRDVHVIPQHITVTPAYYETAGRALLGLNVDPATY